MSPKTKVTHQTHPKSASHSTRTVLYTVYALFLFSERELDVPVRYMLSPVCLSVTFVHPTQPVEIFDNLYAIR